MRKFAVLFCLIVTGVYGTMVKAQAPKAGKASIKEIVGAMTLEEKANLVVGTGMRMPGMPPGGGPGGPGAPDAAVAPQGTGNPPPAAASPAGPVVGETMALVPKEKIAELKPGI
jgi:hypothetical protein